MHFFGRDGGAGPGFPAGFPFFRTGPPPVKNLFRKTRTTGTLFLVVCVKFFAVRIHPIGKKRRRPAIKVFATTLPGRLKKRSTKIIIKLLNTSGKEK